MRTTIGVLVLARESAWAAVGAAQTPSVPSERDTAIATEIERRLSDDKRVNAQAIEIDVRGGTVTLTGRVPDEGTKSRANDIADDVGGVKDVQNELLVGNPDTPCSIPEEMPGSGL